MKEDDNEKISERFPPDNESETSPHSSPDQEVGWMLRFKSGDPYGFVKILQRYEKPVINFAYRILQDQGAAEDVAQDVFLQVHQKAESYRPTGKLSTWIFAIAYHRCLDIKRRRKFLSFLSLEGWLRSKSDEYSRELPDPNEKSPADDIEKNEVQRDVQNALAELPDSQRTAILLAKFEDMPMDEIAKVMGLSIGAIKQLLFRAKNNLKEKLKRTLSKPQ